MPDVDFRYLLLAGLAIALVTAAVTDLRRREIDNWLNAAIALTAPLYWWASGLSKTSAPTNWPATPHWLRARPTARISSHPRHCEERSDEAIQGRANRPGLLRSARNDEIRNQRCRNRAGK